MSSDQPTNSPKYSPNTRLPKTLTPRAHRIIRLLAGGKTKQEVATEVGSSYGYIYKLMSTPMAKDEFAKISTAVEHATVQQIASLNSGADTPIGNALTAEVDATVLESIQKLRSIMNSSTSSPQAQAFAAKELLDLSQAKKRLALLDKGLEDGVEVSQDDIALLATTVKDLRILHLTYLSTPAAKDAALRRFSATEEDIAAALPEEMSVVNGAEPEIAEPSASTNLQSDTAPGGGSYDPAPVIVPLGSTPKGGPIATLGNGPTLPPILGPTVDEMLGG
jgi:DNA-binding CsgD family transcriptional regulator